MPVLDEDLGVLTYGDRVLLELLSQTYADYRECSAAIEKHGRTYTCEGRNGFQIKSRPEVTQLNKLRRQLRGLLAEFGLTPSARSRVAQAFKPAVENSIGAFLGEANPIRS